MLRFPGPPVRVLILVWAVGTAGAAARAAVPEKLPTPAAGADTSKDAEASKAKDAAAAAPAKALRFDRDTIYRFDPIQSKMVAVPKSEIIPEHVYYRYSPGRNRHVWSKAGEKGSFRYTLGPGSVQPVRLFDIRATAEEKQKALESRAPAAAKILATRGAQPALVLDDADRWTLAGTPTDGSVFDLETGRRLEWHGDRVVEVVHSGGSSWSRRGGRYVPAGAAWPTGR